MWQGPLKCACRSWGWCQRRPQLRLAHSSAAIDDPSGVLRAPPGAPRAPYGRQQQATHSQSLRCSLGHHKDWLWVALAAGLGGDPAVREREEDKADGNRYVFIYLFIFGNDCVRSPLPSPPPHPPAAPSRPPAYRSGEPPLGLCVVSWKSHL
mgnify:CR=1 FL=1